MADDPIISHRVYLPLPPDHFNSVNSLESLDSSSPYRLTPRQMFSHSYTKLNWVLAFFGPTIGNIGIGFALLYKYNYVGVFEEPDVDDADTSSMVLDFSVTSFLVIFIMSCLAGTGSKKAISQGKIPPMEEFHLSKFPFTLMPGTRIRGNVTRALFLALQACILYGGVTILLFYGVCRSGAMDGGDSASTCMMPITPYIILKGVWAGIEGVLVFPFIFSGSLNKEGLKHEQYQQFLVNVRLRETLNTDFSNSFEGTPPHINTVNSAV